MSTTSPRAHQPFQSHSGSGGGFARKLSRLRVANGSGFLRSGFGAASCAGA